MTTLLTTLGIALYLTTGLGFALFYLRREIIAAAAKEEYGHMAHGMTECYFWPVVYTSSLLFWPVLVLVLCTGPVLTYLDARGTDCARGSAPWRRRQRARDLAQLEEDAECRLAGVVARSRSPSAFRDQREQCLVMDEGPVHSKARMVAPHLSPR